MITSIITSLFIRRRHRNQSGNKLGGYKYLGAVIGKHDIMLGEKEEFGRGGFDELKCVFICSGQRSFVVSLCPISHITCNYPRL